MPFKQTNSAMFRLSYSSIVIMMGWIKVFLQAIAVTFCTILFVANFWETFHQFRLQQTTLASDQKRFKARLLPPITFCSASGFKTTNDSAALSMAGYLETTYDMDELFEDYGLPVLLNVSKYKNVTSLYSRFRGRCYTYSYPYEVPSIAGFEFRPKDGVALIAYVHEPGEEFWLTFFWLPLAPANIEIGAHVSMLDFQVVTESYLEEGSCRKDWNTSHYTGCLTRLLNKRYVEMRKLGTLPSCQLPWFTKVLGAVAVQHQENRTCTFNEMNQLQEFVDSILAPAGRYDIYECPAPCRRTRYLVRAEAFDKYSDGIFGSNSYDRRLYVYYPRLEMTEYTHKNIMSFNDFISALGGGLGLFLGFSFLSGLLYFIQCMPRYMLKLIRCKK